MHSRSLRGASARRATGIRADVLPDPMATITVPLISVFSTAEAYRSIRSCKIRKKRASREPIAHGSLRNKEQRRSSNAFTKQLKRAILSDQG